MGQKEILVVIKELKNFILQIETSLPEKSSSKSSRS